MRSSSAGALLAERYTAALERIPHLQAPYDPPYAQRTWQSYCVRVAPGAPLERTELMRRLLQDGIATRRGVMAIHEEASYADDRPPPPTLDLPHTEAAARETLMLPLFPDLSEEEQDYVMERLAACMLALAAKPPSADRLSRHARGPRIARSRRSQVGVYARAFLCCGKHVRSINERAPLGTRRRLVAAIGHACRGRCRRPAAGLSCRALDVAGSAILLIVLSRRCSLLIALAHPLDSPGPVLFRQRRFGRDHEAVHRQQVPHDARTASPTMRTATSCSG